MLYWLFHAVQGVRCCVCVCVLVLSCVYKYIKVNLSFNVPNKWSLFVYLLKLNGTGKLSRYSNGP
jgi:hypothetical protein